MELVMIPQSKNKENVVHVMSLPLSLLWKLELELKQKINKNLSFQVVEH